MFGNHEPYHGDWKSVRERARNSKGTFEQSRLAGQGLLVLLDKTRLTSRMIFSAEAIHCIHSSTLGKSSEFSFDERMTSTMSKAGTSRNIARSIGLFGVAQLFSNPSWIGSL